MALFPLTGRAKVARECDGVLWGWVFFAMMLELAGWIGCVEMVVGIRFGVDDVFAADVGVALILGFDSLDCRFR